MASMYLPQPSELVSQGDIFEDIPVAYVLQSESRGNVAEVRIVRAMLISHDCEYDKPSSRFVLMGEIRPLDEIPVGSQGNVRSYRTRNTFYLEPIDEKMAESYVDFRRIDRVEKAIVAGRSQEGRRSASLTDDARIALQRQVAVFFGYGRQAELQR